ncbi:MAG: hypothetical protein RL417_1494 [Pseudomonadota bacterium]|jgi:tRNA1(Val) A37 N6-methylase TrmN6
METQSPIAPILHEAYSLERGLQTDAPRRSGSIYTPPAIAQLVVQKALAPKFERRNLAQLHKLRILDPACGSGVILLAAVELLRLRLRTLGAESELPSIAPRILFGIDKNSAAVEAARRLLARSIAAGSPRQHEEIAAQIRVSDALLISPTEIYGNDLGFDAVIGNPPYGLARNEQLTPEENALLKKIFHATRRGKINKYLAFMARGFEILRPQGVLALIVPNSWLGIKEGTAIRQLLTQHRELHEITVLPSNIFPGRGVETVLFTAHRAVEASAISVRRTTTGPEIAPRTISYTTSVVSPDFTIPVVWDRDIAALWSKLGALTTLASESFGLRPRIALQAYATGKGTPAQTAEVVRTHPFHSREPREETAFRYLHGKDVQPYRIEWSGWYLSHGPWLAEPQRLELFTGPRIVVREILSLPPYTVSAAFLNDTALYNKSILHILGGTPEVLRAIVGILNSKLGSFIFMTRGRKGSRTLFPKILAADLRDLPLPPSINTTASTLSAAVEELERSFSPRRRGEIDELVYNLYGLSTRERAIVDRTAAPTRDRR